MAEEQVTGNIQGPNGERLQIQIGSKAIGLTVKDLIPVLLVVLIGIATYLLYTALNHDLDQLYARQQSILDQLHAMDEQRIQQTIRLHRLLETHEYNMGRPPEERLPLTLEPPAHPKP